MYKGSRGAPEEPPAPPRAARGRGALGVPWPQNLALNIADKGFSISVYNRTYSKTELAVKRAAKEGLR